uniref:FAD-dependent oxidoreductase domain-containing protein 1 n=1 Tax=Cacopsylla melanoneura TaxID=428564 RepID=A0A8D8YB22_9HEMI
MKNHLLSTLTRSLFCKNRTIPCVYLHNQCNRHFSDKSDSKDSQTTKGKDNFSEEEKKSQADAENEKFDELYEKFSKRQLEFQNIDNPPEYIDPATQENHYGLKRALRGLKQEAKRTWRRIQDPLGNYQGESLFPSHVDVLIIGGGAIGSSIACFLKERAMSGCRVAVLDRDFTPNFDLPEYARASTTFSMGGIHHQYSLPENIEISTFGAEYLRNIKLNCHLLGEGEEVSDVHYTPSGYLFCAGENEAATMEENHEVQKELGVNNVLLTPPQIQARFPWLNTEGITLASLGLEKEGWFDPYLYLRAMKNKALNAGAEYVRGEAVNFVRRPNCGINVDSYDDDAYQAVNECVVKDDKGEMKTITFAYCVIAAGAFSAQVASLLSIGNRAESQGMLFVPIPVQPRKRFVYCFEATKGPGVNTPMVVDTSGTYFRREGLGNYYICGKNPAPHEEPPIGDLEVDYGYFNDKIKPHLEHRVKGFEQLEISNAWAGYTDYNYYDQNPLLGVHPGYFNIHFATGFGGLGVQAAPAVGRAVCELLIDGHFRTMDLSRFLLRRIVTGQEVREACSL